MIDEDGKRFRVTVQFDPYFYVKTLPGAEENVSRFIASFNKPHQERLIEEVKIVEKEDLEFV